MAWIDVPKMPGAERAATARARAGKQQGRGWYEFRNATSADEAELFIYDEVGGSWFFGGVTATDFVDDLAGVTAPNLRVRVNSPGGSVFEGLAIANALRAHPSNVVVQVDGLAASIASVITMAADRVEMMPGSMLMIHEASGVCLGDSAEMAKMAEVLDVISSNIADAYAARTGGDPEDWRTAMRAETWYKAQDAVDAGLADAVTPNKTAAEGEPEEMAARFDLAAYGYAGPPKPKPGPPPAAKQPEPAVSQAALSEAIEELLGADLVAALRASVKATVTPETVGNKALPVHHTATTDEPWDGPAAVAAMPNDDTVLRYCFAWQSAEATATPHEEGDDDADDKKANYKFPHHKTKGGPANLAACRNGLARLEGSNIPDGDKAGVRKHLQAHLDDAAKKSDDHAAIEPEPTPGDDGWNALVAHLTTPPDPWATAIQHLTTPASPAATDA